MILDPFIRSPFTDLFAFVSPNYRYTLRNYHCNKLTKRLYNCLEAYGAEKGKTKCRELFYDMYECYNQKIQRTRTAEIKKERTKKYKAGLIDEEFSEKPPMESYFHI